MYINIDTAEAEGIRIRIRKHADSKNQTYLEIVPIDGFRPEGIEPLLIELKDRFMFEPAELHEIEDKTVGLIHHISIWKTLKSLDET